MRFASEVWLLGALCALLFAAVAIYAGVRALRDEALFGDRELVRSLLSAPTGTRRAISAVLITLGVALAFVAAARPQYGKGTRVLPATNLDVVLVLDYSKSMYARDVAPSRTARAKVEVTRLIRALGGARFGAVAFAGDSLSFPLTSDGSAIAQFFRGLSPNDMPLGGTAIARALDSAHQILMRDPRSARHEKVIVLVTDGEDLEGDPVAAAQAAHADGITVEVVQVGGRSPEPIPDVDETGEVRGMRRGRDGKILTTELTAEGERQLEATASAGGGRITRAEAGSVGIDQVAEALRRKMSEELSERVETVFADVYQYPLGLAVLLLLAEAFVGRAVRHERRIEPPKGAHRRRLPRRLRATAVLLLPLTLGCEPFDALFMRNSPVVDDALEALNTNQRDPALELLIQYLETGKCDAGVIGAGDRVRKYGDAGFDLALALAGGDTSAPPGAASAPGSTALGTSPANPAPLPKPSGSSKGGNVPGTSAAPGADARTANVECALRVLAPIAEETTHPADLRARVLYLIGNLELERTEYDSAIEHYDRALLLAPGQKTGMGDAIGQDIAHNRALALRLREEKKRKEEEQKKQEEQNQSQDEQEDQDDPNQDQQDQGQDPKDRQDPNQDQKGQDQQDPKQGQDGQEDPEQKDPADQQPGDSQQSQPRGDEQKDRQASANQDPGQGKPGEPEQAAGSREATASQDDRILDLLEQAPTLQEEEAKQRARTVRVRPTMEDK